MSVQYARLSMVIFTLALVGARELSADQVATPGPLASLEQAAAAYAQMQRGLSTQLDVTDSQLALLTARTNEARAVYDLYLAIADVARAQGKPIPLPPPSGPVPTRTIDSNNK